jgi:hypothetical protein
MLMMLSIVIVYISACYLDRDTPIDVLSMTADDTVVGGEFKYHFDGYRKRYCEVKVYKYALDVKGQLIYSSVDTRPINGGYKKRYIIDDTYAISSKATPGTATFHVFFEWKCPNNVIHLINPVTKDYSDTFEIYANQADKDDHKKSIYVIPPMPPKEENQ